MAGGGESKTEKATPKKRQDERKKGNVFQSKDIVTVASLLIVFYSLKILFPTMYERLYLFIIQYLGYGVTHSEITFEFAKDILVESLALFAVVGLPILLVAVFIGIIAAGVQTRFLFSKDALKPKFSRLSPLQGFKRMFSLKSFIEVIKGLLKISIICYILYDFFLKRLADFSRTLSMDLIQSIVFILDSVMDLLFSICIIFIFVAGLDFLYQRWDYERQIKMSKHDVKEEYKQMEGDPQIKGKIKEKQRQFAMSRMMQAVPTADVVIRNPTHFAVALRYNLEYDDAPVVVAKGKDNLALKIVEIAESHDIYVLENKELTRAIYGAADLNRQIPYEYYNAVAEILALVYSLKNKQV